MRTRRTNIYYWAVGQLDKAIANSTYHTLSDKAQKVLSSEAELRECGEVGVWQYPHYVKAHYNKYSSLRQYFKPLDGIAQRLADDMSHTTIDETLIKLRTGLYTTLRANELTLQT